MRYKYTDGSVDEYTIDSERNLDLDNENDSEYLEHIIEKFIEASESGN